MVCAGLLDIQITHAATPDSRVAAWYPLDTDAADHSGRGIHGTVVGGTVLFQQPGARSSTTASAAFSGGGHIDVPFSAALNPGSFTVTVWALTDGGPGYNSVVTSRDDFNLGQNTFGYILYKNFEAKWDFWTGDGDVGWDTLAGPSVTAQTWTHLAISYDAATGTKRLFVNGLLAATDIAPGQYVPNGTAGFGAKNLHIGAGGDEGLEFPFTGNIDELIIWNEAIPQSKVWQAFMQVRPGDANSDGSYNSSDLVDVHQVGDYRKQRPASWFGGDWTGDGVFDQFDLIASFVEDYYETGPLDPWTPGLPSGMLPPSTFLLPGGALNDGNVSLVYDRRTGAVRIEVPPNRALTTLDLHATDLLWNPFVFPPPFSGLFDVMEEDHLFKLAPEGFGSLNLGAVLRSGLSESDLLTKIRVQGTFQGGGLVSMDLVMIDSIPGDLDSDGDVDFADFAVLANIVNQGANDLSVDFNMDGLVDLADVAILVDFYSEGAFDSSPTVGDLVLQLDPQGNLVVANPTATPVKMVGYSLIGAGQWFVGGGISALPLPYGFLLANTDTHRDAGLLEDSVDIPAGGAVILGIFQKTPWVEVPDDLQFRYALLGSAQVYMGRKLGLASYLRRDVTMPGDPILIVNGVDDGDGAAGPPPAAEGVEHAIDDVGQKYLNFLDLGSGFIVTPSVGPTVVTGLRIYTANDAPPRDPAYYILEGSANGPAGPFDLIAEGPLNLPLDRNPGGNAVNINLGQAFHQAVGFSNYLAYDSYRLIFPDLRDAEAANSMSVAEVEFIGMSRLPQGPITLEQYRGNPGRVLYFLVTGSSQGGLWGTDVYTDDSTLAVAAVHAGVLQEGETGLVAITVLPGLTEYRGTERNGIISADWMEWPGSYRVQAFSRNHLQGRMSIQRLGANLLVTFSPGFKLQQADTVNGPYRTIVGATSPYLISAGDKGSYFRAVAE